MVPFIASFLIPYKSSEVWLVLNNTKAGENLEWSEHDFGFNSLVYQELLTFPHDSKELCCLLLPSVVMKKRAQDQLW